MAKRRMFTDKITESDAFLDMPLSSRCLYFHLCMNGDDDGFINNRKRVQTMVGASEDDYKLLLLKAFILEFESGVIVIKHWRMHNFLRKDRYKPTEYLEEKSMLYLKENGAYTFDANQGIPLLAIDTVDALNDVDNLPTTVGQPNGNQVTTQYKQDKTKVSIEKYNTLLAKDIKEKITTACVYTYGRTKADHKIELIIQALTFACLNTKAETYGGKLRDAEYWKQFVEESNPTVLAHTVNSLMRNEPKKDAIRYTLQILASESDAFKEN